MGPSHCQSNIVPRLPISLLDNTTVDYAQQKERSEWYVYSLSRRSHLSTVIVQVRWCVETKKEAYPLFGSMKSIRYLLLYILCNMGKTFLLSIMIDSVCLPVLECILIKHWSCCYDCGLLLLRVPAVPMHAVLVWCVSCSCNYLCSAFFSF